MAGRTVRRLAVLTAAAGIVAASGMAVAAPPPPRTTPAGTVDWRSCGGGFQCARVRVPVDYDHPSGRTIGIALIRLPATHPAHRIGSLFVNPGGPGGSGVDYVRDVGHYLVPPAVRARFDLVGFDPRGVGRSAPLRCFPSLSKEDRFFAHVPAFPVGRRQVIRYVAKYDELGVRCLRRDATIMQHMSTANAARDLDRLRAAVGDRQLTYVGYSYGSYLGETYANLFPRRVRALIIDGVLDPVDWATGRHGTGYRLPFSSRLGSDLGAYRTFRQFLALCDRAGRRCAFSPGDPAARYRRLLASLRRHPLHLPRQGAFTYADVVADTLDSMYSPDSWPDLARLLQRLCHRRFAAAAAALGELRAQLRPAAAPYDNGNEAFVGVSCADTTNPHNPFAWPRAAAREDGRAPYFGAVWTYASEGCATWPARDADRYTGGWTQRTAHPVLIVNTRYDPATPLSGARAAARLLPGSRLLVVNSWGHTTLNWPSRCADAAQVRYLLTLRLPRAGRVCAADATPFGTSRGMVERTTRTPALPAPFATR